MMTKVPCHRPLTLPLTTPLAVPRRRLAYNQPARAHGGLVPAYSAIPTIRGVVEVRNTRKNTGGKPLENMRRTRIRVERGEIKNSKGRVENVHQTQIKSTQDITYRSRAWHGHHRMKGSPLHFGRIPFVACLSRFTTLYDFNLKYTHISIDFRAALWGAISIFAANAAVAEIFTPSSLFFLRSSSISRPAVGDRVALLLLRKFTLTKNPRSIH